MACRDLFQQGKMKFLNVMFSHRRNGSQRPARSSNLKSQDYFWGTQKRCVVLQDLGIRQYLEDPNHHEHYKKVVKNVRVTLGHL